MTELHNILAAMPVLRAELQRAREETDANGELLLTRQEAGRVQAKLRYLKSLERETTPPVSDEAARAALADFRAALLEARTNQFKDTAVTQGTDALASKVQVDVLLRRIGRLEARLEFFAGTGKPLGTAPMTAAEIATVRGHIEAAQTLRRKYAEGSYAKLTVAEVGLVNTALDGTGAAAQLMQLLASVSVGADALAGLPRRERDLVCNVWMADLKAVFGETVTVNNGVRQRFTKLEAQELRDQLASVCTNARSGQDVSAIYGAYLQAIDTLRTNTNTEVRYESASSAYTDAEARRIRDSEREVKRLAEARGANDDDAIAAQQHYVDTVIEARDNEFVRETVTQLGGATASAEDLAVLRAKIFQLRAKLDYFGVHSPPAVRLPESSVPLPRGLLDRAEFLLKEYADPNSGLVSAAELQVVNGLIGAPSLVALSAMVVNAADVPADKNAVTSALNSWRADLNLLALTDHAGDARRLTGFEQQQLTPFLATVARSCRSTAANRPDLISEAWASFEAKRNELLTNAFMQAPVERIPGAAADDHAAVKAAAQIARMQARLTYLEEHENQDTGGAGKAFSANELTVARAVVEQAALLLRGYAQVQGGPPFSNPEYLRVLDVLVDEDDSYGAQAVMQAIDTFGMTPLDNTFTIAQRSDIAKVWRAELAVSTASSHFTNYEVEHLNRSVNRILMGGGGTSTERWTAYLNAVADADANDFKVPLNMQLDGDMLRDEEAEKLSARVTAMLARTEFMEKTKRISAADAFNAYASISLGQDLLRMYQEDDLLTDTERSEIEKNLQGAEGTPLAAILSTIRTGTVHPSDTDIRRSDRLSAAKVWLSDLGLKVFDTSGLGANETRVFTPGESQRLEESLRHFNRIFGQRGFGSAEAVTAWTTFDNAVDLAETQLSVPATVEQIEDGSPAVSPQQVDFFRARIVLLQARLDDHRAHSTGIQPDQFLQAQEAIDRADYFLESYARWELLSSEFQLVVSQLEANLPEFMNASRI